MSFGRRVSSVGRIAPGPGDTLWFSGGGCVAVGNITTAGTMHLPLTPDSANGVTLGADGNEWASSNGNSILQYTPSGVARAALELASPAQLATFHRAYYRGLAETIDHRVLIRSSSDLRELDGVDPDKLMLERRTTRPYKRWLDRKEAEGRYSWTLASYGITTRAFA